MLAPGLSSLVMYGTFELYDASLVLLIGAMRLKVIMCFQLLENCSCHLLNLFAVKSSCGRRFIRDYYIFFVSLVLIGLKAILSRCESSPWLLSIDSSQWPSNYNFS